MIYEVLNIFNIINKLAPNLWFLTEENFPVDVDYISKAFSFFFWLKWIFPKSSLINGDYAHKQSQISLYNPQWAESSKKQHLLRLEIENGWEELEIFFFNFGASGKISKK